MSSARDQRRAMIRRLVGENRVGSQDELARLLALQGVECTQATLSRDLRDLGIVRRSDEEGPYYASERDGAYIEALQRVVGMEILGVRHNGTLIVVRTLAGRASGVAAFLDSWDDDRILGTVAGDDTILLVPAAPGVIESLVHDIHKLGAGT